MYIYFFMIVIACSAPRGRGSSSASALRHIAFADPISQGASVSPHELLWLWMLLPLPIPDIGSPSADPFYKDPMSPEDSWFPKGTIHHLSHHIGYCTCTYK